MIELYLSKNNNSESDATGEYTREELNKDGKLGWTDKAAQEIAAATAALTALGTTSCLGHGPMFLLN